MTDLKAVMLSQSITSQFSNTVNCNVYISQAVLTGTIAYEALDGKGEYQCPQFGFFSVCFFFVLFFLLVFFVGLLT